MYSAEFLHRYARDRMREYLLEAQRQQALPPFRSRLARKFQALATWLEPDLAVRPATPRADSELPLKRSY